MPVSSGSRSAFAAVVVAIGLLSSREAGAQDAVPPSFDGPPPEDAKPAATAALAPRKPGTTFEGLVEVGAARRSFVSLYNTALVVSAEVGAHAPQSNAAIHFGVGYEFGRTDTGLSTGILHLGVHPMAVFGPVRLGPAIDFVWYRVYRATTGQAIGQVGLSAGLAASVDLLRTENHGLFLEARADYTSFRNLNWGVTGALGARF